MTWKAAAVWCQLNLFTLIHCICLNRCTQTNTVLVPKCLLWMLWFYLVLCSVSDACISTVYLCINLQYVCLGSLVRLHVNDYINQSMKKTMWSITSAGSLSFLEIDDTQEADKHKGKLSAAPYKAFTALYMFAFILYLYMCVCHPANGLGRYEVHYSLEIICEPAAANKVISVQCATQVSSENSDKWQNLCITTFSLQSIE